MNAFSYTLISEAERRPNLGLIVLQSDETVEPEVHQWLPPTQYSVFVSRVPSGEEVTQETLAAMADHITASAQLLPTKTGFSAVAYCCTSGTSVIGPHRITELVRNGCETKAVTDPLSALLFACRQRGIKRLGFLSPYIESVSSHLRKVINDHGVETPLFGSFNESEEAKVAWIDGRSIASAVASLADQGNVDGIFLSCTNLKTYGLIDPLQAQLGMPVLSSNSVLAEHLKALSDAD